MLASMVTTTRILIITTQVYDMIPNTRFEIFTVMIEIAVFWVYDTSVLRQIQHGPSQHWYPTLS